MNDPAAFPEPPSGEALLVRHLDLIERVVGFICVRHHLSGADADDFSSHVKLKFIESGAGVFAKFAGRSRLQTYLTVVIQRWFLDYRISAWGKWRPSAEAKRRGAAAILLEELLSKDRYSFEEACELMATNHGVTLSRRELDALAASLPVRVARRMESEEALANVRASGPGADHELEDEERRRTASRLAAAMSRLLETFEVQERLLLTLRFIDGRPIAEIAQALGLEAKALYRRFDKLFERLRAGLEAEGLGREAVAELLESPGINLEWEGMTKKPNARPSMRTGARQ